MGVTLAGIVASFGNAKVYCLARDIMKVKMTIPIIVKSVKADAIVINPVYADFSMLEGYVSEVDFVFESSEEEISVFETHDCFTFSTHTTISGFALDKPGQNYETVENGRIDKSV